MTRAEEKQRARDRDEERLRRGEITPRELQAENLVFRGFRKDVIGLRPKDQKRLGVRWLELGPVTAVRDPLVSSGIAG